MSQTRVSGRSDLRRSSGPFHAPRQSRRVPVRPGVREALDPRAAATRLTVGVSAMAVLLWLLLRPRRWPSESIADLGGLALLLCAAAAAGLLMSRSTRGWLPIALVPSIALALLGHVGPITAIFGLILSTILSIGLAAFVMARTNENRSASASLNATALERTRTRSQPFEPAAELLNSDTEDSLDKEIADDDDNSEMSDEEQDEGEVEADGSGLIQHWTRCVDDSLERIDGEAVVDFAPGQQTAWMHLPCWPPLGQIPTIEVSTDDSGARAKVTLVERHGFRIEIRLDRPLTFERQVRVSFRASTTSTDRSI